MNFRIHQSTLYGCTALPTNLHFLSREQKYEVIIPLANEMGFYICQVGCLRRLSLELSSIEEVTIVFDNELRLSSASCGSVLLYDC